MSMPMPQGPHLRCEDPNKHDKHPRLRLEPAWCDGEPVLKPFLELVVRVQLDPFGFPEDLPLTELVANIRDEGIGTFVIDEMDSPGSAVALRVRWGGQDRVYPVVKGGIIDGQGKLW